MRIYGTGRLIIPNGKFNLAAVNILIYIYFLFLCKVYIYSPLLVSKTRCRSTAADGQRAREFKAGVNSYTFLAG